MKKHTDISTVSSSVFGFVASLILTVGAYILVVQKLLSGWQLMTALVLLALAQLYVQFVYFLHIGLSSKSRQRTVFLGFTILTVSLVIFGSIWIMNNLSYNMTNPEEAAKEIVEDELIKVRGQ